MPSRSLIALVACLVGGPALAQAPASVEAELEAIPRRPGPARPGDRPAIPIRHIAAPTLSLGNMVGTCTRVARPGGDGLGGLAAGDGIIALIGWAPDRQPTSARKAERYRLLRLPPAARPRRVPGDRGAPVAARVALGTAVSEGTFLGVMQGYSLGMSRFEDGILLRGVKAGECFVAVVEAAGGTVSAQSDPACIDAGVSWGVETINLPMIARQGRARTPDACNRESGKTKVQAFETRVGTMAYTTDACTGVWYHSMLIGYDFSGVHFPLIKAELRQPANAACIRHLSLVTPNWSADAGPDASRPYETLQTRDVAGAEAFAQDVTAWLNRRDGSTGGFQFDGPGGRSTCMSSAGGMQLVVTQLR